jgi:hypothetical protein
VDHYQEIGNGWAWNLTRNLAEAHEKPYKSQESQKSLMDMGNYHQILETNTVIEYQAHKTNQLPPQKEEDIEEKVEE